MQRIHKGLRDDIKLRKEAKYSITSNSAFQQVCSIFNIMLPKKNRVYQGAFVKKMLRIAKCVWFKRLDWLFRAPITIGNTILVASTILPPWDRKFSPMGNFGYSLLLFQIPHAIDLLTSILLLMLTLRT